DPGSGRHPLPLVRASVAKFSHHPVQIEGKVVHAHRTVRFARPFVARPVSVDLDPVPVRVGEVERLAHQVVGEAREALPRFGETSEREREIAPARYEDREVVEAGRMRLAPRTGHFGQDEKISGAVHLKTGDRPPVRIGAARAQDRGESDPVPVEPDRAIEVGYGQVDRADRGGGIDPEPSHRSSGVRVRAAGTTGRGYWMRSPQGRSTWYKGPMTTDLLPRRIGLYAATAVTIGSIVGSG